MTRAAMTRTGIVAAAAILASLGLPQHARGQQDSLSTTCPAVTLVTVPWSQAQLPGRAPQYLPGSFELCPGTHRVVLVVDDDTTRTELTLEPGQRHVKLELPAAPAYPIAAENDALRQATALYLSEGNAARAVTALGRVIESEALSHRDSVAAFVYLNLASAAIGDTARSRVAMESALRLEPCVSPDPGLVTPHLAGAWGRARPQSCDFTRADVFSRSLVLPGLGQYSIGRERAGATHFLRTMVPALTGGVLLVQSMFHYDDYTNARTPAAAATAYDRVSWRFWTGGALLLAAGVFHTLNVRNAIDLGREHEATVLPWIDFGAPAGAERVGLQLQVGRQ